jgi:hypothetical protein
MVGSAILSAVALTAYRGGDSVVPPRGRGFRSMSIKLPMAESPMRIPAFFSIAVVLAALLAVAACTSAPTQEMSDARQAISSARSADASAYAPRSMGSAERLLDQAEQSLKQGRFDAARNDALEARQAAMKAREVAVAISDARTAMGQAKAKGGVSPAVEGLIHEAEAAGQQGDESRAWELATEAKKRLQ